MNEYANFTTSIGVLLILTAFIGVTTKRMKEGGLYFLLNIFGSIFAGIGAFLVGLWPLVVLEIIWTSVSIVKLVQISTNQKSS
jgi:hypothetical protein